MIHNFNYNHKIIQKILFLVMPAWQEPYPGWVDSPASVTGLFMECGKGTNRALLCADKSNTEMIPVDILVNSIITAAWYIKTQR